MNQRKVQRQLACRGAFSICKACALDAGAQWIEESMGVSMRPNECEVCGLKKECCQGSDWFWPMIEKRESHRICWD